MNSLKNLILNSSACVFKSEKDEARALQNLTFKQAAKIAETILNDPWNQTFKWPKDDHPQSLKRSLLPKKVK
ncbi:MAG: hypothetical protein HYT97_10250 [Elusimicrobia bacterium]|nr:hypothetical protein [Elusimicrobiota bacterium]